MTGAPMQTTQSAKCTPTPWHVLEDGPVVAALRHAHALAIFARDVSIIPNQQKRHQNDAEQFANALRALGAQP